MHHIQGGRRLLDKLSFTDGADFSDDAAKRSIVMTGVTATMKNYNNVKKVLGSTLGALLLCLAILAGAQATLLDPNEAGFNGQSKSQNYDELVNSLYASGKTVQTIQGSKMWVPWYKTSSSCQQSDLQSGNACNSGQAIDFTHNCMVTDEFSQVGIIVSMGKDQARMHEFYDTVKATASSFGSIPAWRIYRDGDTIIPCKQGINGNCDTASDATARIIIALYTGAKNPYFTDSTKKDAYLQLAKQLSADMYEHEVDHSCRPTAYGTVCNWLAGGSQVKRGGFSSNNYVFTGYFADAIIAMLMAYKNTGDQKYLTASQDFTKNYLQAAKYNGNTFTVPPGMAFKWNIDANGQPQASCTQSCAPEVWDYADAPRALGMCQANYVASQMGVTLPGLANYCTQWGNKYMANPNSAPIQYYPNGNAMSPQSGYYAQGLQSLFASGYNKDLFKQSLNSALAHYNPNTKTFDSSPCFGVYMQAFSVRALGTGIGRDAAAFANAAPVVVLPPIEQAPAPSPQPTPTPAPAPSPTPEQTPVVQPAPSTSGIGSLSTSCTANGCNKKSDVTSGGCRTVLFGTSSGDIKMLGCEKTGGYVELYRQAAPSITWKACMGSGCISNLNGFARFLMSVFTPTPIPAPTPSPAPAPTPVVQPALSTSGIASLSTSCNSDAGCNKKSDVTSGSCRTTLYATGKGDIKVYACEKSGGYLEVYRQAEPAGINWKACLANGCVSNNNGFARVLVGTNSAPVVNPTPAPLPVIETPPAEGVAGLTFTVKPSGTKTSDTNDASCRTVSYSTSSGTISAKACQKSGNGYEMYLQQAANPASICVGSACVGPATGFAAFTN